MKKSKTRGRFFFLLFFLLIFALPLHAAAADKPAAAPPACAETGAHEIAVWTFAENGAHTGVCALCGETVKADCVYAEPAVYLSKEDGAHAEVCTVCGGERISPCVFGDPETLPPTQDTPGAVTRACTLCGYIETVEELPPEAQRAQSRPLGDATGDGEIRADDARAILRAAVSLEALTPEALAYADMDADGVILAADARLALRVSVALDPVCRHEYTAELKKAAACTAPGGMTRTCAYCGETEEITIPATGHDFNEVTTAATCTKAGSVVKTCKICKAVEKTVLKAKGHDYEEVTTAATCTKDGSEVKTCKVCGHVEKTTIKAAGQHSWVAATAKTAKHCANCGEVVPGWTAVNGKYYYFNEDGSPALNQIVDKKYVDETGVRVDGNKVIDLAVAFVLKNGGSGTNAEKLKKCFNVLAVKKEYTYATVRSQLPTAATLPDFGYRMLSKHNGNCYCYATAFAYIAKVLGYPARVQCGKIRIINGSAYTPHGWTEVQVNGVWYICDAQQSYHRDRYDRYMKTRATYATPLQSGPIYTLSAKNGVVKFS